MNNDTYKKIFDKLPITDMGITDCKGKCIGCCGLFVPISVHEYQKLRKLAIKHKKQVEANANYLSAIAVNLNCYFADPIKKECIVYNEFIPSICKTFHCNRELIEPPKFSGKNKKYMYQVFGIDENIGQALMKEIRRRELTGETEHILRL